MGLQDFPYCFDEKSHKSVNKKLVMFSLQKGTHFCKNISFTTTWLFRKSLPGNGR